MIETIYNDYMDILNSDMNIAKAMKLKEKLEGIIREATCYKTTSKTRVNALKKVASKDRPFLAGYGICGDYKCITDSYHAVAVKGDVPLKLTTTDMELAEKVGKENCIFGTYPDFTSIINFNKDLHTKIKLDYDDIEQFYKLHKKRAKDELYEIKWTSDNEDQTALFNIVYLKNVIDVIGTDTDVYIRSDHTPLYIVNKDDEIGIVLPVKKY